MCVCVTVCDVHVHVGVCVRVSVCTFTLKDYEEDFEEDLEDSEPSGHDDSEGEGPATPSPSNHHPWQQDGSNVDLVEIMQAIDAENLHASSTTQLGTGRPHPLACRPHPLACSHTVSLKTLGIYALTLYLRRIQALLSHCT